jgi:hypothetical protein
MIWKHLYRAAVESSVPARNWRWMLVSFGIGAGFGIIAGLHKMGSEPATFSLGVASVMVQAGLTFLLIAWFGTVAIRFGRSLRLRD